MWIIIPQLIRRSSRPRKDKHGFGEDGARYREHHVQQRQRQQVGDYVHKNYVEMPPTGDPRRFDVRFDSDAQRLRFQDDRGAAEPSQHADDQRQVEQVELEQRAQNDK